MDFSTAILFAKYGLTFAIMTVAVVSVSTIVPTERELVDELGLLGNEHGEH